jgi:hypothetical protein
MKDTDEVATTKFDIEAYLPMKIGAKNDNVSLAKGWIFQSRIPNSIRFCNTLLREGYFTQRTAHLTKRKLTLPTRMKSHSRRISEQFTWYN